MRFRSWPAVVGAVLLAGAALAAPSGCLVQTGPVNVQAIPGSPAGFAPFMRSGNANSIPASVMGRLPVKPVSAETTVDLVAVEY